MPRDFDERPAWHTDALCVGVDPELLFPGRGANTAAIRACCRACPVRADCLATALSGRITIGMWGGTSERTRRLLFRYGEVVTPDGELLRYDRATRVASIVTVSGDVLDASEARALLLALDRQRSEDRSAATVAGLDAALA